MTGEGNGSSLPSVHMKDVFEEKYFKKMYKLYLGHKWRLHEVQECVDGYRDH